MHELDAVVRLQQGDKSALREIVETHQATIRCLIAHRGLRSVDVDDLAQDTFVYVYEHIREFEAGTNFQAWIKSIARFKTLAFLKTASREADRQNRLFDAFMMEREVREDETGADDSPLIERLMACLNKLEERARVVLQRRYAGVPIHQLAEERGQSSAATKMYLFRVRQALKRCVEAHS